MIYTVVICYIPASFIFDVWTAWGWHRCAEICGSSESS